MQQPRGFRALFVLRVFQRAAWAVVGFECCSVEVLGCGFVHWFAAFWAWCAVFELCEESAALLLMLVAVAALMGALLALALFVVPFRGGKQ